MSEQIGIVLRGDDELIMRRAKATGLEVVFSGGYELLFEKTLFVDAGTSVPWPLLPAAWRFLEHWDAAVPLFTYNTLAEDTGSAEERKATKAIVRDLRVLLHSVELLFVRKNEAGQALIDAYKHECERGSDKRLAFLRAVYQVKPRLCVLPVTWLATVRQGSQQALLRGRQSINAGKPLVRVELEPGRFVKCHAGDEQKVLEHFGRQKAARSH